MIDSETCERTMIKDEEEEKSKESGDRFLILKGSEGIRQRQTSPMDSTMEREEVRIVLECFTTTTKTYASFFGLSTIYANPVF